MKKSPSKKKVVKDQQLADSKNRAKVMIHGVENAQTFEHPASFATA
jgi:hypothetical protein